MGHCVCMNSCCHDYRPYHPIVELGTCQIYDVSGNLFMIIPQVTKFAVCDVVKYRIRLSWCKKALVNQCH